MAVSIAPDAAPLSDVHDEPASVLRLRIVCPEAVVPTAKHTAVLGQEMPVNDEPSFVES